MKSLPDSLSHFLDEEIMMHDPLAFLDQHPHTIQSPCLTSACRMTGSLHPLEKYS